MYPLDGDEKVNLHVYPLDGSREEREGNYPLNGSREEREGKYLRTFKYWKLSSNLLTISWREREEN